MTVTPLPEWVATDLDLRHNQLLNARAHSTATAPDNPVKAQLWYDESAKVLKWFDGTKWVASNSFYGLIGEDGTSQPARGRLDFRDTGSIASEVVDNAASDSTQISLNARFGAVVPAVNAGSSASNGTAETLARSDHSHGSPAATGSDSVMTTHWQRDAQLWQQFDPTASFVTDFSGQSVGGGWLISAGGSISWTGDPIPIVERAVYRNSAWVATTAATAELSMGWMCYGVDGGWLGKLLCVNRVAVDPSPEIDPTWQVISGHIMTDGAAAPAVGEAAPVEAAVSPPDGTVYFQPFIASSGGQLAVDTHEVARNPREVRVLDAMTAGSVISKSTVEAAEAVVTPEVRPPETSPETLLRMGPLLDPPEQAGDAVSRGYVDRLLGLSEGDTAVPPQFLWAGEGDEPVPDDLDLPYSEWPLNALWLDTSVRQARASVVLGAWSSSTNAAPLVTGWNAVPNTYRVVITAPADGVMVGISVGNAYTSYTDWLQIRCGGYSNVNDDGDPSGTGSYITDVFVSSSSATDISRTGFTAFSVIPVSEGLRYMFRTEYSHGGPDALMVRDRTFVVYLPGGIKLGI